MTGGFNVPAVGSRQNAASEGVCSESTCAMSCLSCRIILAGLFILTGIKPSINQRIKKKEKKLGFTTSVCVTVKKTLAVHPFRGFHDYSQGEHSRGVHTWTHIREHTYTKCRTLRVFCAGSLEPITMRPGPPMLQTVFRCRPSSTGTVETA